MNRLSLVRFSLRAASVLFVAMAVMVASSQAQQPTPAVARTMRADKPGSFTFSLLPKSFQKNPMLDMTANTDFTPYGKLLRPATPESPVYYVAQPGGFKQMGSTMGGERPPLPQEMETAMKDALAVNGYLPANPAAGHFPSLVVIYSWGSHNRLDRETAASFPQLAAQYRLERAMLVGGRKYAANQSFIMEWGDPTYQTIEKEYLNYQVADSLYFVAASAYDYASLAHGERKLAWRTTMTVNAIGVSLRESLPPLIANSAPILGRETIAPQIIQRRMRDGVVELGTPTIVEPGEKTPASRKSD